MANDNKSLQNKEIMIRKEVEYLHRQFPWKSHEEIAAVFSEEGDIDKNAFKQLSAVRIVNKVAED